MLATDDKNLDAQIVRGNALAGLKDLDGAIAEYEQAITVDPSRADAYINMGTIQFAQGKNRRGRGELQAGCGRQQQIRPRSAGAREFLLVEPSSAGRRAGVQGCARNRQRPTSKPIARWARTTLRPAGSQRRSPTSRRSPRREAAIRRSMTLAQYYVAVNKRDEARALLRDIAKRPDGYAEATVRLAALDVMENRSADAKTRIHEVLAKYPKNDFGAASECQLALCGRRSAMTR